MARTHNIFISHSWAYSDAYDKLIKMLNSRPYFFFINYSVPQNSPIHNASNDRQLYKAIKNKIAPCSVVIIMAGVYGTYSKWINKEIKIAKSEFSSPKPIIAIEPWGSRRTSSVVKRNADKIVKWQSASIVTAIRDLC